MTKYIEWMECSFFMHNTFVLHGVFFALGFHPLSYNAQHHHTSQLGFWRRRRCRRQPMKSLTINTVSLQRTNEPNKKKPTANCTSIRTIASSVVATAKGWRRHIDGSTHTWTRAYRPFSSCVSIVALYRAFFPRALSHFVLVLLLLLLTFSTKSSRLWNVIVARLCLC